MSAAEINGDGDDCGDAIPAATRELSAHQRCTYIHNDTELTVFRVRLKHRHHPNHRHPRFRERPFAWVPRVPKGAHKMPMSASRARARMSDNPKTWAPMTTLGTLGEYEADERDALMNEAVYAVRQSIPQAQMVAGLLRVSRWQR